MTSSHPFAAAVVIDDRDAVGGEFYEARFLRPDVRADPYPAYRALRAEGTVVRSASGFWIVTGHPEARQLIHGPRISSRPAHLRAPKPYEAWRLQERFIVFLDAPDHTVIRHLAHAALKRAQGPDLERSIAHRAAELLDDLRRQGRTDIVDRVAVRLPVAVMLDILGVPEGDREQLRWCTEQLVLGFDPIMAGKSLGKIERATHVVNEVLSRLVAQRRAVPEDDVLSALATSDLSDRDVVANAIFLVIAGYETSSSMIANGTLTLLRTGQLARLAASPELVATTVDEVVRYESPIQFVNRTTLDAVEVGGVTIPAGDEVLIGLGAANRDERAFADPDRFDIERTENPHLGFALGAHYCMGAHLARLEGAAVFTHLAEEFPGLRLVEPAPPWRRTINFRTVKRLLVAA